MNAHFAISSKPEVGTTFTIQLHKIVPSVMKGKKAPAFNSAKNTSTTTASVKLNEQLKNYPGFSPVNQAG
jgi:hypothetical protein